MILSHKKRLEILEDAVRTIVMALKEFEQEIKNLKDSALANQEDKDESSI